MRRRDSTPKPRSETAGSRKTAMAISPRRPDRLPSRPPTGEMPLVESVAIAWQRATKGVSPQTTRSRKSAAVMPA